jgi:hypothetical protein
MSRFTLTEDEIKNIRSLYNLETLLNEQEKDGYKLSIKQSGNKFQIMVLAPGETTPGAFMSYFITPSKEFSKFYYGFDSSEEAQNFINEFIKKPLVSKKDVSNKNVQLFSDEAETQKDKIYKMDYKDSGKNPPELRLFGYNQELNGSKNFQYICGNNFFMDELKNKYYNKKFIEFIKGFLRCPETIEQPKVDFQP